MRIQSKGYIKTLSISMNMKKKPFQICLYLIIKVSLCKYKCYLIPKMQHMENYETMKLKLIKAIANYEMLRKLEKDRKNYENGWKIMKII